MKTILLSLSAFLLFVVPTAATCQGCSDATTLKNAYIGNLGTKSPVDGLIHITYGFVDTAGNSISNSAMQTAFDAAFSGWNGYSSVTGVKFDPAPGGSSPDLSITGDNKSGDNCIGSDPGSLNISYGTNWSARFNDPAKAPQNIVGVEHEIGHILGMADNIPSIGTSIMNKASSCSAGSNATGLKPSDSTSTTDAGAAGICVKSMLQSHSSPSSSGGGGGSGDGSGGGGYNGCYVSYVTSYDFYQDAAGNVHAYEYHSVDEIVCY